MDVKNNPAGRLYDLLLAARGQQGDVAAKVAWAKVFGVPEANTGILLKMLADLIDLMLEAKAAVAKLEDVEHDLYLQPFKNIESMLSNLNLEARWQESRQRLDEATMIALRFVADKLSRVSGFTQIKNEEVDQLEKDLEGLIARVKDSQLPDHLKSLLIRNLEALGQALFAYRVRGIEGLEQELDRAYGSIVRHKEEVAVALKDKGKQDVLKSVFEWIDRVNKVATFARNMKEIGTSVAQLVLENWAK
jgi:hypothetical protein